jgi:gallate dioxygenase
MWLTMRGALSASVRCKLRSYYLPSMAGIATAIYEATRSPTRRHRRIGAMWRASSPAIERLPGTYPFTLERSVERFRINDYLHRMVEPAHREAFMSDPEASFEAASHERERSAT